MPTSTFTVTFTEAEIATIERVAVVTGKSTQEVVEALHRTQLFNHAINYATLHWTCYEAPGIEVESGQGWQDERLRDIANYMLSPYFGHRLN